MHGGNLSCCDKTMSDRYHPHGHVMVCEAVMSDGWMVGMENVMMDGWDGKRDDGGFGCDRNMMMMNGCDGLWDARTNITIVVHNRLACVAIYGIFLM